MIETLFLWLHVESMTELSWVLFGLAGQLLFMSRFIVQWLASERAGRSVVPVLFWYFSISGGLVLFAYGIWRRDPVIVLGQSIGLVVYSRNLWLIHGEKRST